MDLWIRSQVREMLCKAECVDLMHDTFGYAKVFLNGKFPDLVVGAYENKRALEVLDEIQTVLGMVDVNNKETDIKFIPRDCIVYEMPKE